MTSFNVAPFYLYNEEHDRTVQRLNSNIWAHMNEPSSNDSKKKNWFLTLFKCV